MRAREAAPSLRNCTRTEFSRLYDAAQHSGQWGSALTRRRWRRCQRGRRCPCRSRACACCNFRRGVKLTQRRMEASGGSESPQRVEHSLLRNHSARAPMPPDLRTLQCAQSWEGTVWNQIHAKFVLQRYLQCKESRRHSSFLPPPPPAAAACNAGPPIVRRLASRARLAVRVAAARLSS